ncbi:serine/threonine-protein kinase-like protein [Iris pallida]|uniref:Serine/threonine-protein kinase-like protein n=1 Tax=Iris pallida TaxID=29817 RepID=A0AAX6H308_IRIPA|nr:serine/threonine-protein kinase-like protein [Iris pallida]
MYSFPNLYSSIFALLSLSLYSPSSTQCMLSTHPSTSKEQKPREKKLMELSYEEIRGSTKDFSTEQLIGKGSHGCVYRGTLKCGKQVAVKKPSEGLVLLGDDASKLDNEIDILSSLRNPNIVNMVGFTRTPNDVHKRLLVTEFMPNGSLHSLLHSPSPSSLSRPMPWPRRVLVSLQVARATHSLHEAEPSIVHRDIKPANILFDRGWNARLADFSLAVRACRRGPDRSPAPAGTLGYLDPCYTAPGKLGPNNDVYSFGVVLLELFSSTRAMEMGRDRASVVGWAVPLIREGRVAEVCDPRVELDRKMERLVGRVLAVAELCVSRKAERRPAMADVLRELSGVAECLWWRPSWDCLRNKVSSSAHRCVRAWKRCNKKRVTTTTVTATNIACKDHLIDSGYDDDDGDGGGGGGGGGGGEEEDEDPDEEFCMSVVGFA